MIWWLHQHREGKRWAENMKRSQAAWDFFRSLERSLTADDKQWIEDQWHLGNKR